MALLIPFSSWIAGCRREAQSARLPGGPETARLARAPGSSIGDGAAEPVIPAYIDPEVMMSPDMPARGRVQAMADREAAISGRHGTVGRYVLPEWTDQHPSLLDVHRAPAEPSVIWSRPVDDEDSPFITPLQFMPALRESSVDQLMAMATRSHPNLDPLFPMGDPTLIPGMFFGPNDLALAGLTRNRPADPTSVAGALPPPLEARGFDNVDVGPPAPIIPTEAPSSASMAKAADEPEPSAPLAVIRLKPIGKGTDNSAEKTLTAPTIPFAIERARVDAALEEDLLKLPEIPELSEPAVAPGSSASPIALDITAIMASPAWEKGAESTVNPGIAPTALPLAAESSQKTEDTAKPGSFVLEELQFSEITPPPLPDVSAVSAPAASPTSGELKDEEETKMVKVAAIEQVKTEEKGALSIEDIAPGIITTKENTDAAGSHDVESETSGSSDWLKNIGAETSEKSIDPLTGTDFSLYDWELKIVPQKLKLTPVAADTEKTTDSEPSQNDEPKSTDSIL
jgi:hypothetical protein